MAPTEQNVKSMETIPLSKVRLIDKSEHVLNNNTILPQEISDKVNDIDFNISKYEAMKFRPRIKWPDLIVQVSLHLVTVYGFFLVITNEVKYLTVLFGK